jgi:hypothetical protein
MQEARETFTEASSEAGKAKLLSLKCLLSLGVLIPDDALIVKAYYCIPLLNRNIYFHAMEPHALKM